MSETKMLPLALLYTRGRERIEGATRFQKLVFIAQEEYDVAETFTYYPDKFGPYSWELERALDIFIDKGWVEKYERTNEVGNVKFVYSLTPTGQKLAHKMVQKGEYNDLFDRLVRVKEKYNNWPLQKLLRYVYNKHPDYTTDTQLDLDRLYDPDTRSQFLEPGESEFLGAGPEGALEVNSSADDLFPTD